MPHPAPAFASALSRQTDSTAAIDEVCDRCAEQFAGTPDLAVLFLSAQHAAAAPVISTRLRQHLQPKCVIGGTGESIVGVGTEVELDPAISLWIARLPDVEIAALHLSLVRTAEGGSIVGWPDPLLGDWPDGSAMVIIGDPFTFPADYLLERMNEDHAGVPVIGGMCSAGQEPGANRLFLNEQVHDSGAVAVRLHGKLRLQTVVSQGCRPIGEHYVITQAEQNVIRQLGGLPAFQRLEQVYRQLATREQQLMQRGLHVGRVVSEYQDQFEQGDFLIRNVVGVDPEEGSIAIGDFVRAGQTVQFHIRDADTADAEFQQLLAAARKAAEPKGALLFTCNGRGSRLFSEPHHDAALIQKVCGEIPLAGFFAAGEIGPIGGCNFLHGFTASLVLFSCQESETDAD